MEEIEYRHPCEDDLDIMTDIFNRGNRDNPHFRDRKPDEIKRWTFEEDDYDPVGYLLAFVNGKGVAYGGVTVNKKRQESGMKDAYIGISVILEHRGKGMEQHILQHALAYLKERGLEHAKMGCYGTSGWDHELASEFGMQDVRHSYTMIYDKSESPVTTQIPVNIKFEHTGLKEASDEVMKEFVDGLNDSFADHYDFSPASVDRFKKTRDTSKDPMRVTIAKEGNDIAGVLLVCESDLFNQENGTKVGWAFILGVSMRYRKRGIGRALLSDGMKWIWDRDMDTIYLNMDAENEKALDLYKSLGFKVDEESINYQLDL